MKRNIGLGISNPDDYLDMANGQLRKANALRDDMLAVLFPYGEILPSELLQTKVKLKFLALVNGIEQLLLGKSDGSAKSWDLLVRSGLLREKALVHFALARIAEEKLRHNMQLADDVALLRQLPAQLLNHENGRLAEMAGTLLNADQRATHDDSQLYRQLSNEHLHLLCWRIVAVLQQLDIAPEHDIVSNAHNLLARHDEMQNSAPSARKLVFFLGAEYRAQLNDPRKAGLALFIASIAQDYGLESDLITRLIAEASPIALLLMLKGKAVPAEQVIGIVSVLRGPQIDDAEYDLLNIYGQLDPVDVRATVANWAEHADGDS
jgi:hypothetical protein